MKIVNLNRRKHMIKFLVHYEKHNQIIMWICLWHCWLFKSCSTPFLLQPSDRIWISFCNTPMYTGPKYSPSQLYYPEAEEHLCALREDRDFWKGSYGFGNEEGWHFRSGIKMARKSCLINSQTWPWEMCQKQDWLYWSSGGGKIM